MSLRAPGDGPRLRAALGDFAFNGASVANGGEANSKYTPAVAKKIVSEFAKGVPKKYAAQAAGISYDALNDWEHGRGGIPEDQIDQFRQSMMMAEGKAVSARVSRIANAAREGDWRADAWHLEHVYPDTFASRSVNEHTGRDGDPLKIVIERVTT